MLEAHVLERGEHYAQSISEGADRKSKGMERLRSSMRRVVTDGVGGWLHLSNSEIYTKHAGEGTTTLIFRPWWRAEMV